MSQKPSNPAGPAPDGALSKSYEPHAIETRLYQTWESHGYFAPAGTGAPYCIMIPPPNVTGSLHMGHAFQDTLMDALIRYRRMRGERALWQAGTDHAGIATQMVVERQLEGEGKTRHDLGREEFVQRIWQWKAESGGRITQQLRRLGASLDWSRERFTMDAGLSRAVTEVFVRLYEEGLLYRGQRLVNWDPVLHTAVSDLEVISEEEAGHLWHIRYPVTGTKDHLVVATTRPETMLGDTAVAVHPEDERYQKYIGKTVDLPLTGRKIPVIADEYVDRAFGSGCVKITPAHDFNDYEVGKRHNLPLINIFYTDAGVNLPGSPYHDLDRFKARQRIVADLEKQGLLERVQEHKLMVPRGDRSGAVIEPYLTDQWFVKAAPLAEPAIRAVEKGHIKFVPENWSKTYFEWMKNIQDWCISRQIWWGHRIPAWYDADGNIYVARDAAAAHAQARQKHGQDVPLEQDEDVLDTWFSSALWPFSTLGWPDKTPELKTFYPSNVLVTGFDIIFFWVARMIMMGLKFMSDVPFREVYITGLIRDAHGQKMSKSKGNILDPLDLVDGIELDQLIIKRTTGLMQPQMAKRIEAATRKEFPNGIPAFGTDALRFTLASLATQGRDIKFDLGRIEGYRNFCNKLWNAARYVLMNTEGQDNGQSYEDGAQAPSARPPLPAGEGMGVRADHPHPSPSPQGRGEVSKNLYSVELNAADRWIDTRLQEVTAEVETAFRDYRFDLAAQAIYSFIWHEYCDWYLELSKVVLTDPRSRPEQARGARRSLLQTLETALRLLHPIMPFITEEIWLRVAPLVGKKGPSIMREPYPVTDRKRIDPKAVAEIRWVMAVVTGVRNIRGEMDIAPGKTLPLLFQGGSATDRAYLTANRHYLTTLARAESTDWIEPGREAPESATALVGEMKVLIPLGSLIDKRAELSRLAKEMEKIEKDLSKAKTKLANPDFTARAPKNVVEQEQSRVQQFESALSNLRQQRAKVEALPG